MAEIKEPTNKAENTEWLFEVSGLWDLFFSEGWDEEAITWPKRTGERSEKLLGSCLVLMLLPL